MNSIFKGLCCVVILHIHKGVIHTRKILKLIKLYVSKVGEIKLPVKYETICSHNTIDENAKSLLDDVMEDRKTYS